VANHAPGAPDDDHGLAQGMLDALDALLRAFVLEPLGGDRFRVEAEPGRFGRIFGGQTVAQALLAAAATVTDKNPQSLHVSFVDGGDPAEPLELEVDRVRDGRTMSTRRVGIRQGDRTLLVGIASFHANPPEPHHAPAPPVGPGPDEVPRLQDWILRLPADGYAGNRTWVEQPPPVELRNAEPPSFLGFPVGTGSRSHWMRLPAGVGDDPLRHAALLAYASDFFLLDMLFRDHPQRGEVDTFTGTSLDHSVWFHRPVRFDRWHLHTQDTLAISGHRGLARGAIHDADGRLVASTTQEGLVRPAVR
jgi:acyl-CoA thioesterase II